MSLFGDFGPSYLGMPVAAGNGNVTFAVQDFTTDTGTGLQSYTSATITGVTPVAAFVVSSLHDPTNDPDETAGASINLSFIDATEDLCISTGSKDASTTTDVWRMRHDLGYNLWTNDGSNTRRGPGALISGGISLNFTNNEAPSLRSVFAAIAGTDASAHASFQNLGTGTSAIDVIGVGFQPDIIIMLGHGASDGPGTADFTTFCYSVGIATNHSGSVTQRCVAGSEFENLADSRPFQTLRTDCAMAEVSSTDGSLLYKVTLSDFDADGFSLTPSADAGSDLVARLALKTTNRSFKLVDFDTPTVTGAHTITGAGFTPRFALAIVTNLEALDSHPGVTSDNQCGFGICLIGSDEQWSTSWRVNSGEATTDTASQASAVALMGPSATDCDANKATFTAWTADGVTLNFSAAQGTAKKGFILFVE
jgi:hypothetical protein